MALRFEPFRRPSVKFVIPSAGVFALYLGGLLGVFIVTRGKNPPSWFSLTLSTFVFATLAAFGAMTAADSALGAEASHVDILKTLAYMVLACFVMLLERQLGDRVGWALPQFVENLVVWGAGVASIWEEEPGFPGWAAVRRRAARRLRPASKA